MSKEYILRVKCPDKYGIVAKVFTHFNKSNLFILDSAHYGDPENKYFMRAKLIYSENELDINNFQNILIKNVKA